jgi:GNAT superfamily N-acetyltransferase
MVSLGVRRTAVDEAQLLRALTLSAVGESPNSFGPTLAEVEARDAAWWARHAQRMGPGGRHACFVLTTDGTGMVVGLCYGLRDQSRETVGRVGGMWVSPESRSSGGGRMLLRAAVEWARGWNAETVELWAPRDDQAAVHLYASCGFERTGAEREHRPGMHIVEMRFTFSSS